MRKRPLSIVTVSLICVLMGPFYMAYQVWSHGLNPIHSIETLNPLHMVIAFLALPVGIGIFRVQTWGYFSFLTYSVGLVTYFLYEYFSSPVIHTYSLLMASVILVGATSLLLQRHLTAPYFNPKLKWWERDPRFRVNLHADFQIDGDSRRGQLLDLSLSGCYASVDSKLLPGDTIYVGIQLLDHRIKTMARVIWVNQDHGGYGIMFTDLEPEEKKELKGIINYLALSMIESGTSIVDQGVPKVTARASDQAIA